MSLHKPKIVIAEAGDYSADAFALYQQLGEVQAFFSPEETGFDTTFADAIVLVVRLARVWNEDTLSAAQHLQYIVTPTTGLDHIDLEYCASKNIKVLSLKGETHFLDHIPSTAEHTWALLMATMKRIVPASDDVLKGEWNRNKWKGHNLEGKTFGIVGLGRVGRQVARFAAAFGMQVLAYDVNAEQLQHADVQAVSIIDLLQQSDVISIHIPGAGNDDFLSAELLNHCKPGAILINTSRGNVWNETAVAKLVEQGKLMAVATDVIHDELGGQLTKSPLWQLAQHNNRVLITPHIAGATFESMAATEVFMAQKLLEALL